MIKNGCSYESAFDGETLIFSLSGEIDHHSAANMRSEMDGEISRLNPKKLIMELSKIEFMDSSGLGLIMGRYALMQRLGGTVSLRNPNERLIKIFELSGLFRIIRLEVESEETKNER